MNLNLLMVFLAASGALVAAETFWAADSTGKYVSFALLFGLNITFFVMACKELFP